MAKAKASTSNRKPTTVAKLARTPGGKQRIARELAAQRRAGGAAQAARAAANWGIKLGGKKSAAKGGAKRGGASAGGGRNG